MNGLQNKPVRASSARAPVIRPQSSKNRKMHQKTQFIENVYGSTNPNNPISNFQSFQKNKHLSNRFNAQENDNQDVSKLIPRAQQMNKQREQLFEQNLHLKRQLNRIKDQMMKSRTKIQNLTSKNQKYTKQFNRQFEKKMYWNGNNSYLISGVKAQYQKLRQQFNQKQQLCEALKRQLIQSRAPEYKIYAQTLQEQNKKLNERINKMAQVSQNILFDSSDQKNKSYADFMYSQLENKLQKIDQKYKQSELNVKNYRDQCKDLQRKIQFLQKLIIQKDNAQYHAVKKAKKLERQKISLDQRIRELSLIESQISKNYQIKLQKLRIMEQKRFKVEKDIFDRTIQQKDIKLQKLQKQVAYLSTLLTYWKPLDQLNRQSNQRFIIEKEQSQLFIKQEEDKKKKNQDSFILDQKNLGSSTRMRKATQFQQKNDFVLRTSVEISKQSSKIDPVKRARVQQTAQKRHSDLAQKKRRVDYKEIEHLGEHLRYRFLGLRLHINEIRKYFDYQKQSSNPQNNFILENDPKIQKPETQQKWQQQYITMRQVKDILKLPPFELLEEQAHLLARYMIEDTTNEFAYVDLNNQHKRSVVKSILKALVGDYQILNEEKQIKVEKECQQMMQKYQSNLLAALSTMASSGYVSRRKFIELINSLGIELSEQGRDLLVCKMLLKSQNLNKLAYMIILD